MADQIGRQLLKALKKIDRPGSFCTSGKLPAVLPGLEVEGVGSVALPLGGRQAGELKKQARQAPYGKRQETLVDTDVRRVWEIDAGKVSFANPQWPGIVDEAVRTVQSELGLEKQKLVPHLYKLLLYEPGSFFLSHRDGEKLDRMVATLVIALPSAHEGGELIVRHEGREETIDFGGDQSAFGSRFAAFYADCEHEIRPLKSGYRLAAVYNLTLRNSKSRRKIGPPANREHVDALSRILKKGAADQSLHKLAVLLDHKYTQAGLAFETLKGIDRTKAGVLFEAARESQCEAYLALVTMWESGSAEPTEIYYGSREYGYEAYGESGEYEMGEVFDASLTAEHFSDRAGNRAAFGTIPIDDEEIVSDEPIEAGQPDDEDFEGYTGNAGMTLERWYHRAAVILWPETSRFDVLCEAGVESAVVGLEQMVRKWPKAKKSQQPARKEECLQFARQIIAHWPQREYADRYVRNDDPERDRFLPLLEKLDDASLVADWLGNVLSRDVTVEPGKMLANVCKQHGWPTFQDELMSLFENTTNESIERNARLLAELCLRRDKNADRRKLCAALAAEMLSAVERWDSRKTERDWRAVKVDRAELLMPLMKSLIAIDQPRLLTRLVDYVNDRSDKYDITTVQMPALLKLQTWLKRKVKDASLPLQRWLTAIDNELETRAANPPQAPSDWKRESTIPCKCADCQQLIDFLDDPTAESIRLPLAKARRRHLHNAIDGNRLDVTHVTERRGSPYTLVCTKTNASHERAVEAHQQDLEHLQAVQSLLKWHGGL